jgi:hypothetical protein
MAIDIGGTTLAQSTFSPTSGTLAIAGNLNVDTNLKATAQPAFNARGAASSWLYAGNFGGTSAFREVGSAMSWTNTQQGAGSYGFNNSTGRYTAPVAGFYFFYASAYYYNDNNTTSNYIHFTFSRNGTTAWNNGVVPYTIYSYGTVANHADGITANCMMYLNVGDYCSVFPYWGSGGSGRFYSDYFLFCGALLG